MHPLRAFRRIWRRLTIRRDEAPTPVKKFKRGPSSERDLLVLAFATLLEGKSSLKALVAAIVRLGVENPRSEVLAIRPQFNKCAAFAVQLARFSECDPPQAEKAIASFSKTVLRLEAMVMASSDDEKNQEIESAINESIAKLKKEHSFLDARKLPEDNSVSAALQAGLSAGLTVLSVLKEASEAIPIPALKPIFTTVAALLHAAYQTQLNHQEMRTLSSTAATLALNIMEGYQQLSKPTPGLGTAVTKFHTRLSHIVHECRNLSSKNIGWAFLQNVNHRDQLEGLRQELDDAYKEFEASFRYNGIPEAPRDYGAEDCVDTGLLNDLERHRDLTDVRNEYMVESRLDDEKVIGHWIDSVGSDELVLWIHATVGLGKTTLARHIGEKLLQAGRLAASVFFDFVTPDRQTPGTILEIIAKQLGTAHPEAASTIADAISRYDGPSLPLQEKLHRFIREPLRCLGYSQPLVIILDGIEVWESFHTFLSELATLKPDAHLVKFIVLTRTLPDTKLNTAELSESLPIAHHTLQPVSATVMEKYFQAEFDAIAWDDDKPGSHEVALLAEKANGVFIWARTVCAMIKSHSIDDSPNAVFDKILRSQLTVGESAALAALYLDAMTLSFREDDRLHRLKNYLQATFALKEAIPTADFARLVGMKKKAVERLRDGLYILPSRVPGNAKDMVYPAYTVFHLSVVEYFESIADEKSEETTGISPLPGHERLAQGCLELLHLVPSPSSGTLPRDKLLQKYISRFWVVHLAESLTASLVASPVTEASNGSLQIIQHALQNTDIAVVQCWAGILFRDIIQATGSVKAHYQGHELPVLMQDVAAVLDKSWESVKRSDRAIVALTLQVACLEIAACLEPANPDYWHELGKASVAMAKHHITSSVDPLRMAVFAHHYAAYIAGLECQDSDRARFMSELAYALMAQAEFESDNVDGLSEAAKLLREALALHPPNHVGRCTTMAYLASCLCALFEAIGDRNLLDESIFTYREALSLLPESRSERGEVLQGLAFALNLRADAAPSDVMEDTSLLDLEESIHLDKQALEIPEGKNHHHRRSSVNLATSYRKRFQLQNTAEDLHKSIATFREALAIIPSGHPLRKKVLPSLSASLHDLVDSEALAMHHDDRQRFLQLSSMVKAHRQLYQLRHTIEDVEEAIRLNHGILRLIDEDQVDQRALYTSILCDDLRIRYLAGRQEKYLNEGIKFGKEALSLCLEGPGRLYARCSWTLTLNLQLRAKHIPSIADLAEAIHIARRALDHCDKGDVYGVRLMGNLWLCRDTAIELGRQKTLSESDREALEECMSHIPVLRALTDIPPDSP
ncbi:hypothetical protein NMY22_g836 [Coprinellus aureogranulatus]|nr:hypothetical protein NMY22_g836 [Coprinellus aureogranulatus]